MKRSAIIVLVILAASFAGTARAAHDAPHIATGSATLASGLRLTISTDDRLAAGRAWLGDLSNQVQVEIGLSCVSVEWVTTPYPIFPSIPYHVMHAAGYGVDGNRYFITVYDLGPADLGRADEVRVSTHPGGAPCGGDWDTQRVYGGDFAIGP